MKEREREREEGREDRERVRSRQVCNGVRGITQTKEIENINWGEQETRKEGERRGEQEQE